MKLRIEYIDEDSGEKIIVKNKGNKVLFHSSEIHVPMEFEDLTDRVFKFEPNEKKIIDAFYDLASNLI